MLLPGMRAGAVEVPNAPWISPLVVEGKASALAKKRWWHRLLRPFRPEAIPSVSTEGCGLGFVTCVVPGEPSGIKNNPAPALLRRDTAEVVLLTKKADNRGLFSHHWLEVETSRGRVTFGFGPATIPFIDAGQIGLEDEFGNVERLSGGHPVQWLTMPPVRYKYARHPGSGITIGAPIPITLGEAEHLIRTLRQKRRLAPYIPLFYDCRTFVCRLQERARGRSGIRCHLLFKGYW